MNERTHIDLFTGLAGFALAARANGVRTIGFCEIDARCQDFLRKAWPGVPVWPDIKTFSLGQSIKTGRGSRGIAAKAAGHRSSVEPDACCRLAKSKCPERWEETQRRNEHDGDDARREEEASGTAQCFGNVWLLTAGVPCQPASRAGKQRGKEDSRWLWPEALRVIAAIKPTWALLENPPGIGDVGLRGILTSLEAEGYEVRVLSIPACAVNAPHRRERYWIVCHRMADSRSDGHEKRGVQQGIPVGTRQPNSRQASDVDSESGVDNATEARPNRPQQSPEGEARDESRLRLLSYGCESDWHNYVWLPCADGKVRRAPDDSFSLVDGLHRSLLGALGNSIVPQVASQIIAAMIEAESI